MVNVENVKKVRELLGKLPPSQFKMNTWLVAPPVVSDGIPVSYPTKEEHSGWEEVDPVSCGTAACIGGWATILMAKEKNFTFLLSDGTMKAVINGEQLSLYDEKAIADWLGLNDNERYELFYATNGPRYIDEVRLEHAIKVLDHLIETGEIDWSEKVVPIEKGDSASRVI